MNIVEFRQALKSKSTSALKMNLASFHSKLNSHDPTSLGGLSIQRKLLRTIQLLIEELYTRTYESTEWTRRITRY